MQPGMNPSRWPLALRVSVLYSTFGALWIALSDRVAALVAPTPAELTVIQTYKGWLFVVASGLFLLAYLARENNMRRSAQADFAMLFGQALEGIYRADLDGAYLKVNPALARMYGYFSLEEFLASVTDTATQLHLEPKMFQQLQKNLQRNGFIENFEARHRRKDGTAVWTSTTARIVRSDDGRPAYCEGFVNDITIHKNAEQALLEHEQQYRMLFESAPIGIGVTDEQGRILAFNDAILEPGGYTRDDIEAMQFVQKLYWSPEDRARILDMQRQGKPVNKEHVQFQRKDGSVYDAL